MHLIDLHPVSSSSSVPSKASIRIALDSQGGRLAVLPVSASSCRETFDAKAVFVRAVLAILGVVISSPVVISIAISHVPPVVRLLQSLKTT